MNKIGILCFLLCILSTQATSKHCLNTPNSSPVILDSIEDLADNNIEFGKEPPRHGLALLYALVHSIDIDNNDVIRLENTARFGSHEFRNKELVFSIINKDLYKYYTIGNLNQFSDINHSYVKMYWKTKTWRQTEQRLNLNRDRIVILVPEKRNSPTDQNTKHIIEKVYITQHIYDSPEYDKSKTYEISRNLIKEILKYNTVESFLQKVGHKTQEETCNTQTNNWPNRRGGPGPDTQGAGGTNNQGASGTNNQGASGTNNQGASGTNNQGASGTNNQASASNGVQNDKGPEVMACETGSISIVSLFIPAFLAVLSFMWLTSSTGKSQTGKMVPEVRRAHQAPGTVYCSPRPHILPSH